MASCCTSRDAINALLYDYVCKIKQLNSTCARRNHCCTLCCTVDISYLIAKLVLFANRFDSLLKNCSNFGKNSKIAMNGESSGSQSDSEIWKFLNLFERSLVASDGNDMEDTEDFIQREVNNIERTKITAGSRAQSDRY